MRGGLDLHISTTLGLEQLRVFEHILQIILMAAWNSVFRKLLVLMIGRLVDSLSMNWELMPMLTGS
jgi:hypothetical protein